MLAALGCAGKIVVQQPVQTVDSALGRLRKNIRKYVQHKQDRKRALAKIDNLRDVMVAFNRVALEWRARGHEAGPDDEAVLLAIADDINAQMREHLLNATKIVYSLREDIPANAWARVFLAPDSRKAGKS